MNSGNIHRGMGILPMSSMAILAMSITGILPVAYRFLGFGSQRRQQQQRRHEQDARATHGRDARNTHGRDAHATRRRGGFTLIEAVLSVAITAVIGLSLTGVMVMAQKALAGGIAETDTAYKTDRAMQMILMDINLATSMPERTAHAITVVVPDRDGGGQSETIRYAWDGVAGDPLTRQYNGGTVTTLAENIYQFNFSYLTKTLTASP
jgi:type II secretory pathway pseudopilin PulG